MANIFEQYEIWWVTGAQLLYGGETVKIVDGHSKEMVEGLNNSGKLPIKVVYKGTANSSKEAEAVMKAANNDVKCIGIITWMHTFSPAKMWIKALQTLQKPLLHFHTQYNAEIPWESIDMDFMNLNQSAHGDIEFGHICTRMRVPRKVVCGYWKNEEVQEKIAVWARVAAGVADAKNVRCLMFGMNMNNVAVTDGDRVEFEQRMGYHVDYYPVSSLMDYLKKVTDAEADALVEEYKKEYEIKIDESGEEVYWEKVKNAAKAEIALRRVLADEGATAFTTNFDDLGDADIIVKKHLEVAVKEKMIKASLEASVTLKASGKELEFIKSVENELAAAFIVSEVVIEEADGELQVTINKADGEKCERCWCFSKTVGENSEHPTLCARCAGVIE